MAASAARAIAMASAVAGSAGAASGAAAAGSVFTGSSPGIASSMKAAAELLGGKGAACATSWTGGAQLSAWASAAAGGGAVRVGVVVDPEHLAAPTDVGPDGAYAPAAGRNATERYKPVRLGKIYMSFYDFDVRARGSNCSRLEL